MVSEQKRKGLPYVTRRERRDVIASLNSMAHDMGCTVEEGNHVPEQNVKIYHRTANVILNTCPVHHASKFLSVFEFYACKDSF